VTIAVLVPVIILVSLVVRGRALFVRQPLRAGPLRQRILISVIVGVAVVALGATASGVLPADLVAIAAGAAFGWLAARWTRVEDGPAGRMYRPNKWAAGAIAVLFVARVAYRLYEVLPLLTSPASLPPTTTLFSDPLTSALFVLTFAYYAAYCGSLLRLVRS